MTEIKDWINQEHIEFKDQVFGDIDLTSVKALPNPENFDFNTELVFDNCEIKSFIATAQFLGKRVTFKNCKIGRLSCHATYFFGGLLMINCIVEESSTFDCGVHNISPNEFILDNCTFHGHLDFFDVYFEGPVQITNNVFTKGTSIELYLNFSYGIEGEFPFKIENNKGQMNKYADNDPFNPENKKR